MSKCFKLKNINFEMYLFFSLVITPWGINRGFTVRKFLKKPNPFYHYQCKIDFLISQFLKVIGLKKVELLLNFNYNDLHTFTC